MITTSKFSYVAKVLKGLAAVYSVNSLCSSRKQQKQKSVITKTKTPLP